MPSIFSQMKKSTSIAIQMKGGPQITKPDPKAPEQMEAEMTDKKELPSGALGWKPDGTADYGQGVQGWWNGIQSRITAPEDGAEPDAIDVAKRVGGEVFNQVVGALNVPQQKFYEYVADRRSYEMYADMVNQNTPDIYEDNELGNFLRLTTSILPGVSNLTTMFEKDRIQNGNRQLPDGTFEKIQEANRIWNKDNVGTAIFNTQIQAEYVRRVLAGEDPYKLTKEMSKPLHNFIADLALDPLNVLDGLGIGAKLFGKGLKGVETLPELAKVADGLKTAALKVDDANEAMRATRGLTGQALKTARAAAKKMLDDVTAESDKLITEASKFMATKSVKNLDNAKNISMALSEFTQDAKRVQLSDKLEGVMLPLSVFARGNVQTLDNLLKAFAKFGSSNADEAAQGAKILQDNKILHLFLSDNAAEVARFMNKMDNTTRSMKLDEITDTKKFVDEFKTTALNVFEELYPDTNKVADALDEIEKLRKVDPNAKLPDNLAKYDGYTMSPAGKFIARQHKALQEGFLGTKIGVKPINEFFSLIYLTSPGFAVRNYLNAAATTFMDFGPKGLRDMVDFAGSAKYVEDMFGLKPESIARAFSAATTSKKGATGIMKPFEFMRKLAGKGEEYESMAVAATAGKKYSKEMLKAGRFIESMDNLKKAGFSDDTLKFLEKKVRQYNGQTDKALAEFTAKFNAGSVEHFREPEVIFNENLIKTMDGYNPHFVDEIREVMKEGTLEEILQKVDNMLVDIEKKTYSTIDDIQPNYTDEASQALIGLREGLGLSDEGLDPFAKKRNIGRNLEDAIIGTASEILPKGARQAFTMEARKYTADIMNFQGKFSTTVKSLVSRVGNGSLGVKELVNLLSTDPMFAKMGKLATNSSRETAVDMIWTYYKKEMLDLWIGNSKKQYELLLQKIGDIPLNGKKGVILDNLKMKFNTDFRYLNADLKDGKALINEPFFQHGLGNRLESIDALGKKLKLFDSELQKGAEIGKNIPYRETTLSTINRFLKKAGLGKVGDLNVEANYNQAVKALVDYSNVKERLNTARGLLKGMEVPADLAKSAKKALGGSVDEMQKVIDEISTFVGGDAKKLIGESKVNSLEDLTSEINRMPDPGDGNIPNPAKVHSANYPGTKKMFNAIKSSISNTYGKAENVSKLTTSQAKELTKWADANEVKMLDFRTRLLAQMKAAKDFALLDYAGGKKNLDLAMAYIFPYQFWYSRTYANWIKRLVANPVIINRYQKYREFQEEQNKDLPDYMRNYVVLGKSIGMADNPLMMNLEASLNPLNGITGVDFTDKNKIVGTPGTLEYAWTKTLDSIGKFGPSPWTPINLMTAAALSAKGEKDAAARWAGRFFPQSGPIKALASIFGKNVELDPIVLLFDDGSKTDPYESRRVGRALIALKESGKITMEQAYEAARTKTGPVWEEATVFATKNRSLGTLSAYMLGQGFKFRSGYEAEIDKFYEEYFKMWANKDKFSPDEMSNYQRYIRTKYEWADLVILANKGSKERDKAYAYSVLGRIAPGQNSEIAKSLGLNAGLMDKFYADKGEMEGWNPLDRESFMNSMVQLGTLLAIPKPETLNEWQNVKLIYRQIDSDLVRQFGADINQKIEAFYESGYDSMEQKNYMEGHPDVQEALDYKDALIAGNPVIAPYYDGLTRLERYYDGEFRRKVTETIDPNYYDYYKIRGLIIDPNELKAFDRQVNWTTLSKKYFALKKEWDMYTSNKLNEYDKYLGTPNLTTAQKNVDLSVAQANLMNVLQPPEEQQPPTWEQIRSDIVIPLTLEKALQQYFATERVFNSTENTMTSKLLNNINQIYGLNLSKEDMLGLAMDYYR